ncbi:hypothetical protein L2E82_15839 [Cichorium intybus]|uniref:Uncharacterized protein n=1 Tax=Cichorium intybus TaxID=13427 RepID=A0ACB9F3W0_CICIN|nr:hypothetical protein L2E82_15839 [Cichorium intybus]
MYSCTITRNLFFFGCTLCSKINPRVVLAKFHVVNGDPGSAIDLRTLYKHLTSSSTTAGDDDWIHEKSTNVIRNTVWVYVFYFRDGKPRIDWKDFNATRELTRVLLLHHRSITWVGISLPTVEVRFQNLSVEADCHVGDRALPTLINSARNIIESLLATVVSISSRKLNFIQGYYNNIVGKEMAGGGGRAKPDEQRISSQMFPIELPVHPHGVQRVFTEIREGGNTFSCCVAGSLGMLRIMTSIARIIICIWVLRRPGMECPGMIPAVAFEDVIRQHAYGGEINPIVTFATLGEKTTIISPKVLLRAGVPCCRQIPDEVEIRELLIDRVGHHYVEFERHDAGGSNMH